MSKKKSIKDKSQSIEISAPTNFRSLNAKDNFINSNLNTNQLSNSANDENYQTDTNSSYDDTSYVDNTLSESITDDNYNYDDNTDNLNNDNIQYDDINNNSFNSTQTISKPVIPSSSTKPKIPLNSFLQQQQQQVHNNIQHVAAIATSKINSNRNEKIYFKVTPQLLKEVKEWEEKKLQYTKAIDLLLYNKSKQLEIVFDGYLDELKPILEGFSFDDSLKRNLLEREHNRLEDVKQKLFGSKNASISALEEQISTRKREINMHNKITLIQAHVRGWLQRIRYRKMMHSIELRNRCAKEIVETERNYVQSLSIIINQFLSPLQNGPKKDLLSNNEITAIFSNISLLHGVHKELLDSLEKKYSNWSNQKSLAVCFLNLTPFLKLYSQYVNNFNNATSTLNECKKRDQRVKDFFFKDCKGGDLGSRDFLDLQIQPVQRIPRYKLLLTELLQHTPSIHKDYENIKLALKEIQKLATSINESKREAEGFEKTILIQSSLTRNIEIIQPFRKHIKDTSILFEKRGKLKERHLFLFNDSILLCKKLQSIFDSQPRYSPVTFMKLSGAIVLLAEDPEFKNGFAILGNEHLYFYAKTPVEQLEWFLIVKEIVSELEQTDSTLKRNDSGSPIVRESLSMKFSQHSLSSNSNNTNSNSSNVGGNIIESPTPSSSNLSNLTIVNPRNSIKIENQSKQQQTHPLVIEKNSKLLDNSHSNNTNTSNNNNLHFSPTSSTGTSNNNIFPPLVNLNNSGGLSNSNNNIFPQLQSLSASTTPTSTTSLSSSSLALNLTIRELINIYNEINQLQTQLFQPTNQLEVVFGNYIKSVNLNELNQNFQKVSDILSKIINLKNRSIVILKEDEISSSLQNIIAQGKDNIGSFNSWLKSAYPLGPSDPNSQQPRALVINLMKWYNNLFKVWSDVLDYKST